MSSNDLADFIDDAADYMEQHGSCGRSFEDNSGKVCILGALRRVYEQRANCRWNNLIRCPVIYKDAIHHIMQILDDDKATLITVFNDAHNHQQRLDMLRKAAKSLRS